VLVNPQPWGEEEGKVIGKVIAPAGQLLYTHLTRAALAIVKLEDYEEAKAEDSI